MAPTIMAVVLDACRAGTVKLGDTLQVRVPPRLITAGNGNVPDTLVPVTITPDILRAAQD